MNGRDDSEFSVEKVVKWLTETVPTLLPEVFRDDFQMILPELMERMTPVMEDLWIQVKELRNQPLDDLSPEEAQKKLHTFFDILFRGMMNDIPPDEPVIPYILETIENISTAIDSFRYLARTQYHEYRKIMAKFSVDIIHSGKLTEVQTILDTIDRSPNGMVLTQSFYLQFFEVMEFLVRRFNRPSLETTNLCLQIYLRLASLSEKFLPVLLSVDHLLSNGETCPLQSRYTPLSRILQHLERNPRLALMRPAINHHVRNAIAHNRVIYNPRARKCQFLNKKESIIWTNMVVLQQTRELSAAVIAMWQFRLFLFQEIFTLFSKMLYSETEADSH